MDQLAHKIESFVSYYMDHAGELYRPLLTSSVFVYLLSLLWTASTLAQGFYKYGFISGLEWAFVGVASNITLLLFSLATRSRLNARSSTSITLFATWIVLNLVSVHLILMMAGTVAFLIKPFRERALPNAPAWYRSFINQLFSEPSTPQSPESPANVPPLSLAPPTPDVAPSHSRA